MHLFLIIFYYYDLSFKNYAVTVLMHIKFSGMQATMVQCRCLDGDLASTSDDLKTYSTSLHQVRREYVFILSI